MRRKPKLLTREQQIKLALKVLAPAKKDRADWEAEIIKSLDHVEYDFKNAEYLAAMSSKEGKRKLHVHLKALKKVQNTGNALLDLFGPWFVPLDLKKYIDATEHWLTPRAGKPKPSSRKQRLAVTEARRLLQLCGREDNVTRHVGWCKLAAILFGDEYHDLFNLCRIEKKESK